MSPRRARLLAGTTALLLTVAGVLTSAPVQAADVAAKAAVKLQVPSVKATSTPTPTGTQVTTTVVVRNRTASRKPANDAVAYLLGQGRTYVLGDVRVPATASGASVTVTKKLNAPVGAPAGKYAVQVCLAPRKQGSCRTSSASVRILPSRLVAAPGSVSFGDTPLGVTTDSRRVTITNRGHARTGALRVNIAGDGALAIDANTCYRTLDPGASCHVDLDFTPATVGSVQATLTVIGTRGGEVSVPVSGTGTGGALLSISPDDADLDATVVGGTSDPETFTVTNTGTIATGVIDVALGSRGSDFTIATSTCAAVLGPAASCTVTVTFAPATAGAKTEQLRATATPGGTATAELTGTALAPASLSISPTDTDLGPAIVGDTTDADTFTVTNDGDVASGIPTVVLAGANADQFTIVAIDCTASLAPGASCEIEVAFAPTSTGPKAGRLAVSAAPGGGVTADLQGTGRTAAALSVSETAYDFGFSDAPAQHTFTITNDGTSTSGVPAVDVTGASAFAATSNTCTAALAGGASCTVAVTYTYTGTGSAVQTGRLSVSATPGGTVTADLSGSPQALTIAPTGHDYGGVLVGGSSAPVSYILTNHRLTAVQIDDEGVTGPFPLDTSCFPTLIPAGGTCTFSAHFAPTSAGPATGSIDYVANGDQATVDLTGTGIAPASLSVDRGAIQFGAYAPMATGTQVLTVTNTGTAATSAAPTVTITGADAAEFGVADTTCTAPLAGGDSCTVTLAFAPLTLADQKSATATVDGTPATSTPTVALAGISAPTGVSFVPATYDYGTTAVGSSTSKTYLVVNTTDTGSEVNSGNGSQPFNLDLSSDFTCVLSIDIIQPHGWCTFSVAFSPQGPGSFTGTITVGGAFGSANAVLSGTAVPARPSTGTARRGEPDAAGAARTPQSIVLRHGRPVLRY